MPTPSSRNKQVRYAVVGLGHFSQVAALPGLKNAPNSTIAALVSGNDEKLDVLSKRYGVRACYRYDDFERALTDEDIQAVYIATPNCNHSEFTERAAQKGVHVLCEKPMALTSDECRSMIRKCETNGVKLMIAYRLHFEPATLNALKDVKKGKIGEPKIFNSTFCSPVEKGNIRVRKEMGGGSLYDIGIYCINAARTLFQAEPTDVMSISINSDRNRFDGVDEASGAILRFPNERLATFVCSFGASSTSAYEIVGTKGRILMDPAYHYATALKYKWFKDKEKGTKPKTISFPKVDQLAAEFAYFSDCILKNRSPEPSGDEGLIDVEIIQALLESAETGERVQLKGLRKEERPSIRQERVFPPHGKPKTVDVSPPK
jgi:predicted dehydrogenase